MCKVCENKMFAIGSPRGCNTNLGDDVGSIHVEDFLIFEAEDEDKEILPAMAFDIYYKDRRVYSSRQHINFCPFCGRNLKESE